MLPGCMFVVVALAPDDFSILYSSWLVCGDDGSVVFREGGDLALRGVESVCACAAITACDWVNKFQHSIVQWASTGVENVDAVWLP